jgi:hypothetical protein
MTQQYIYDVEKLTVLLLLQTIYALRANHIKDRVREHVATNTLWLSTNAQTLIISANR